MVVDSGGSAWGGTARDDEFEAEAAGDVGAAPAATLASLKPPYLSPWRWSAPAVRCPCPSSSARA